MSSSYYEIVQLADGDYVLQQADGEGEHLVRISFGSEAKAFLQQHDAVVVKAMIDAAIQTVDGIRSETPVEEEDSQERVIH